MCIRDRSPTALASIPRRTTLAERARALFGARAFALACADLAALPFASGVFGCLWSNLALPYGGDPEAAFREWHRVLEPEGLLMFSTYGPDTLKELRAACAAVDAHPRVHAFVDMHDLGDMLIAAGFDVSCESPMPCLLYTSPSPRDGLLSRMPSSA